MTDERLGVLLGQAKLAEAIGAGRVAVDLNDVRNLVAEVRRLREMLRKVRPYAGAAPIASKTLRPLLDEVDAELAEDGR